MVRPVSTCFNGLPYLRSYAAAISFISCLSWVPRKVTYTLAIGRGRFWNTDIDNPVSEARQALLDELISQNDVDEPLGFTAMIKPYLAPENSWQLELDDYDGLADGLRNSLSLRFFSYENYNITAPET